MVFTLEDENRFSPPISKSRFNPATAQATPATMQCWLKNADGAFLHFSGEACALERAYRWHGTAEQAKKLRQRFAFAQTFRILVPTA